MGRKKNPYVDLMACHPEVTGSCILCNIQLPDGSSKKVLVDCGLFQEDEYFELNKSFPFDPTNIDYVLITHNHIDHIGRLPLLVKKGFRGTILMTESTKKLISKALYDSYKVLKINAKTFNEHCLYEEADVSESLKLMKSIDFDDTLWLDDNIKVTFFMNGHLPGAACILLQVRYKEKGGYAFLPVNLLFTGDYNNKNMFFDVPNIPKWVYQLPITIVQECTYGDMYLKDIQHVFKQNFLKAIREKKDILIPVFSLGRAQELMLLLKRYQDAGELDVNIPIYFDGTLGVFYTELYQKDGLDNKPELKDFLPQNFSYVSEGDHRSMIIKDTNQKIILSTSGMGSYGPCQTYLPIYLKRSNALIHFTGYCAEGTLGRRLYEGLPGEPVKISGLQVEKKAEVQFTSEFSAHAKADELLEFLKPFEDIKMVLLNHAPTQKKEAYGKKVIKVIQPKDLGILDRNYYYRIDGFGLVKTLTTKFY